MIPHEPERSASPIAGGHPTSEPSGDRAVTERLALGPEQVPIADPGPRPVDPGRGEARAGRRDALVAALRHPRAQLIVLCAVLCLVALVSVMFGQWIATRSDYEPASAAPGIGDILVPVESQRVRQEVHFSASPERGTIDVVATAGEDVDRLVATAVRIKDGQRVRAGDVLLALSDRPVVLIKGVLPAYRDITPFATGKDVVQLKKALRGLGYSVAGDPSGTFGPATQRAVTRFYEDRGYKVALTSATALDDVEAARKAVTRAQTALGQEQRERARARSDAQAALDDARQQLRDAKRSGDAAAVREAETAVRAAKATLDDATAPQPSAAADALDDARTALSAAIRVNGVVVPRGEILAVPSGKGTVTNLGVKVGQIIDAGRSVAKIASGTPHLLGELDGTLAAQIEPGMRGTAEDTASGTTWHVEAVGSTTGAGSESGSVDGDGATDDLAVDGDSADGDGGDGSDALPQVRLAFVGKKTPTEMPESFDATIVVRQTPGEVLAVPSAAVSLSEEGTTSVTFAGTDGAHRVVAVETGLTGAGMVEIRPLTGDLKAGDMVVVGREAS